MPPRFSFYTPADFGRVLNFMHAAADPTLPYGACRFQFCMAYHVQALRLQGGFEMTCGLWEDDAGLVSLAMTEGAAHWGETFFLFRDEASKTPALLQRMCEFAERFTSKVSEDKRRNAYRLCIPESDGALAAFAQARGYAKTEQYERCMLLRYDADPGPAVLPEGFTLLDARAFSPRLSALAHYHSFRYAQAYGDGDGVEQAFAAIRRMPDYRPELDLVIVDAEGQPAGLANYWVNPLTKTAKLEPLGTVWWYRRKGLAKALILEGVRRTRALGCTQMVGGDQPFYWNLGFAEAARSCFWAWSSDQ